VRPACDMPKFVGKNKNAKLVINNLQITPLDGLATYVIHGKCDEFLSLVMKYLEIEIPPFTLFRRVITEYNKEKKTLQVVGIDIDETPATIFYAIEMGETYLEQEPFQFENIEVEEFSSDIICYPMGHYKEQPFSINVSFNTSSDVQQVFNCIYNLEFGWNIVKVEMERIRLIEVDFEAFYKTIDTTIDNTKKKSKEENNVEEDKSIWHSVVPKEDCIHVNDFVKDSEGVQDGFKNNKCFVCEDKTENWYCYTCGKVFCSRYVKGHGLKHYEETGHPILLSFSDLSTWCYLCEEYIVDPALRQALFLLHLSKFGKPHPHDHSNQYISRFFCNECAKPINEVVYHCTECEDYDLCQNCFKKTEFKDSNHKPSHDMNVKKLKK